eukprot:Skav200912  [mRNA]  locus=scaffold2445:26076:31441:+ [translate_table: standard]
MVVNVFGVSVAELTWSDVSRRRDLGRNLLKVWDTMMENYHRACDAEGVHCDDPLSKRARRGRSRVNRAAAPPEARETADDVAEVRVGTSRASAIRSLLQGATEKSFEMFIAHLSVMGAAKSALSDSMLNCKVLWPLSGPAEGFCPSAAEELTRQAGRKSQFVPKLLTATNVDYNQVLSPSQHDLLVQKLLSTFEEQVLGDQTVNVDRVTSLRPSSSAIGEARFVVQMWDQGIEKSATADLQSAQLDMVRQAVLSGNALDSQILASMRRSWPHQFHMAMLPDVAELAEVKVESREQMLEQAESEEWQAKLRTFKVRLGQDIDTIKLYIAGQEQLSDVLDFMRMKKKLKQAEEAKSLIDHHSATFAPTLEVQDLSEVAGAYAHLRHAVAQPGQTCCAVVIVDLSVPGSRNALIMPKLAAAAASICKISGLENSCLLIHSPTRPKEESDIDPMHDEIDFLELLRKQGFVNIRWFQSLEVPAEELLGQVPSAPILPNTEIQSISEKAEDLDGSELRITPATRSSQKGHEAHEKLLHHLITGTKLNKVSSTFLKGAHIDVVDLHAHSGDKLLASLMVSQSQQVSSRDITLRHVLVQNNSIKMSIQAGMFERACRFSLKRLGGFVAKKWLAGSLSLKNAQNEVQHPDQDYEKITADDETYMKSIPGVYEAYSGFQTVARLNLNVVCVEGSTLKIGSLTDFAGAPAPVTAEINDMVQHFDQNFSDKLRGALEKTQMEKQTDPRAPEPEPTPAVVDGDEAGLRAQVNITIECKAMDVKNITVLNGKDDNDESGTHHGSLYMVLKALQKGATSQISVTGHTIDLSQHGFSVQPTDEKWIFQPSQKKGESKATSGNAMRNFCTAEKKVAEPFGWLWRCSYDATHCRLGPRKPFLTALSDMKIDAGKTVKVHQ